MKCIAVIPARGGSKGIPRKNLKEIAGVPLITRTVRAAMAAKSVDAVFVSTDDEEIADAGSREGARIIRRPSDISGDTASSESALLHALNTLALEGIKPEFLVFLQCTSPFTQAAEIDNCVDALEDQDISVGLSVIEDHGFFWHKNDEGEGVGVNHDETLPRKRRQDSQPQYRETGSIYALRVEDFVRVKQRFCGKVKLVLTDAPPLEIDSESDFEIFSILAEKREKSYSPSTPVPSVQALVMDFDGVLTDDKVTVSDDGHESVTCSRGDGLGLSALRQTGMELLILSKERNPVVTVRGTKLQIPVMQGIDHKAAVLVKWAEERKLALGEIAYIGNDVNDLECLQMVGWAIVPADGHPEVKKIAHHVTTKNGGQGAVREICDLLVKSKKQG
jgi:YrbI family 3-deoxy-D-manno-octulosonate 8-phosphate phosphatase